jgi:hypothetical protein
MVRIDLRVGVQFLEVCIIWKSCLNRTQGIDSIRWKNQSYRFEGDLGGDEWRITSPGTRSMLEPVVARVYYVSVVYVTFFHSGTSH